MVLQSKPLLHKCTDTIAFAATDFFLVFELQRMGTPPCFLCYLYQGNYFYDTIIASCDDVHVALSN